ncbi:FKBP-type peptidyl-prolyl cis-trans isomerase [Candidatus Sumerlaeota bacterium]|nr:FKBP-type peptidyl-prolyl cis-trans isomerase [Candidatus Sumerlaeota bacterium]
MKRGKQEVKLESFIEGFKAGLKGEADQEKISYGLGGQISRQFHDSGVDLDIDEFLKGMQDHTSGAPSKISDADQMAVLNKLRSDSRQREMAKMNAKKVENLAAAKKFLEENKTKEGVKTTASGLQYKVIKSGDAAGKSPSLKDVVSANYRGTLINGTEFDSSAKHGGPQQFGVGGVIKGWTEALQLMKPGDKWQLFISPEMAYGEDGFAPDIEPNSALIFDIELVSVEKPVEPAAPQPETATK